MSLYYGSIELLGNTTWEMIVPPSQEAVCELFQYGNNGSYSGTTPDYINNKIIIDYAYTYTITLSWYGVVRENSIFYIKKNTAVVASQTESAMHVNTNKTVTWTGFCNANDVIRFYIYNDSVNDMGAIPYNVTLNVESITVTSTTTATISTSTESSTTSTTNSTTDTSTITTIYIPPIFPKGKARVVQNIKGRARRI